MAPAAKKGSKKVQSFVVDCTRPVRVDSFARIVFASKSEREKDAFFLSSLKPSSSVGRRRNLRARIGRFRILSLSNRCETYTDI